MVRFEEFEDSEGFRMANTRRGFLQSTATVASGLATAHGQRLVGATSRPEPGGVQLPKVRFGKAEISRLVVGSNQFYGYSHFNRTLDGVMRDWYTPERVCETLRQCEQNGINAFQYIHANRGPADWERYKAEGGKMHLVAVAIREQPEDIVKTLKPLALFHHGEVTDRAFRAGQMAAVREYTKRVRQTGALVGVSTHKPEVIATIEEEGWDVDFYLGCVYNRTRTPEELRKLLGEVPMPPSEVYLEGDPARMYKVMRQTKRTCFAFKILGAGRVVNSPELVERAFRTAYESIKPSDCVIVGMFPRFKDEVKENAEYVRRILAST